jgi:hypothetical protein
MASSNVGNYGGGRDNDKEHGDKNDKEHGDTKDGVKKKPIDLKLEYLIQAYCPEPRRPPTSGKKLNIL